MSNSQASKAEQGMGKYFFRASAEDFKKISGGPIAYWVSQPVRKAFTSKNTIDALFKPRKGIDTGSNELFLRFWFEVNFRKIGFDCHSEAESEKTKRKWFPYNKGGEFRKWYGNFNYIVDWESSGFRIRNFKDDKGNIRSNLRNQSFFFQEGLTWTDVSSSCFGARYLPAGFMCDNSGSACYGDSKLMPVVLGMLTSKIAFEFLKVLNPTLHFQAGNLSSLPLPDQLDLPLVEKTREALSKVKSDWDSYETSWDFISLPLLHPDHRQPTLKASYQKLRAHWREMTLDMQRLEQENNRIFIDAYGLQDELTPDVPLNEITLTCNPHYRYGGDKSDEELEAMLLADTMRELVSCAVGCMLGRYSLDKPGLILANQGETLADYLAQVPQPSFPADDDNVIPMLDGDWFADDITLRFRQFLRVAFGEAHYDENLAFIEQALNVKGKRNYSLRDYFLSEFYADHVKRYKKRPIYWLFSSPKGSFNALIYMHRYRPDTVSVVLKYLRDYREKLSTEKDRQASVSINPATSQGDKTRALKEVERLSKVLAELEDYERDVLYPLATEQKAIDLDDGVKVNYLKFGAALKKITGLDAKEED